MKSEGPIRDMSGKPSVIEALSAVMAEVQAVGKNQRNTEQGYNFRGVDAVVNAVGPIMRKHGVVAMPLLESASYRDVLTSRGKPSRESTVEVRYRFYGPAGDSVDAVVPGEAMDFGDKGVAKAMSVAYRIVLLQALCIPTDEPDPDEQTYERTTEDEWKAAKPATDDQATKFTELLKLINAAGDEAALKEHGPAVKQALADSEITEMQFERISRRAAERLAEDFKEAAS